MTTRLRIAVVLLGACLWAAPASAFIIFSETFDGPSLPTTVTYDPDPDITWSIQVPGELLADMTVAGSASVNALTVQGFTRPDVPVIYSLDVGFTTGGSVGSTNVGMTFGGYRAIFHPGLGNGAFRMEGGFSSGGNQNMGFTPALDVLHHMEVETRVVLAGLQVDVLIRGLGTDALMHEYNFSFLDTSPNLGLGQFGGRRSGPGNALTDVFFDNYQVEILPEPTSMALLSIGALGLIARRRRR